jgi:hypothetical protein
VNDDDEKFLIIPFPIDNNKPITIILDEFDDLNINHNTESTIYGIGINISYQSHIDIIIEGKPDVEMRKDEFSLMNDTIKFNKGDFWIYSSINGSLNYEYSFTIGNRDLWFNISNNINKGWQLIEGYVSYEIVD